MEIPIAELTAQMGEQAPSLEEMVEQIKDSPDFKVVGTATIDGKKATIIDYSLTAMGVKTMTRVWMWSSDTRKVGMST